VSPPFPIADFGDKAVELLSKLEELARGLLMHGEGYDFASGTSTAVRIAKQGYQLQSHL
jgi:hypothetical protein